MTRVTQRSPMLLRLTLSSGLARLNAREPGFGMSRPLASPRRAGSSVVEARIATSTPTAAATPIALRNGMPTTRSPSRAMTTVPPANTTALPAVATAVAADSSGVMPCASCVRWRERDEQAIVDADCQGRS